MPDFDLNRRNFVLGGLLAGIIPLATYAKAQDASATDRAVRPARFHNLFVDRQIPESVRLGACAGTLADEVVKFDGDFTSLWVDRLRSQWSEGPRPIAGLTAPGVRLVLEQLGRDHDARIVFAAEHHYGAKGVRHRLIGCGPLLQPQALCTSTDWVAHMARHIATCPHEFQAKAKPYEYVTDRLAGVPDNPQQLVTWVLAPVIRHSHGHNSEAVSL